MMDWFDPIYQTLTSEFGLLWIKAFLLTQCVEVPIYLYGARSLPPVRRWAFALGASTITHPVLWFAVPWEKFSSDDSSYLTVVITAETVIVLIEGLYGKLLRAPRALLWALCANVASVIAGLLSWLL